MSPMGSIYVEVKNLPATLQYALQAVGYGRKDVVIYPDTEVSVQNFAGDGKRGFYTIVDLATGKRETTYGSWGGPNAYVLDNRVDLDDKKYQIPANVAVICGTEGGGQPVYAVIHVNPSNLTALLPAAVEVTDDEKHILACYRSLKSGAYRVEAIAKVKNHKEIVDSLVARGLLKRSSNGATQITTEGKNAIAAYRPLL